MLWGDPGSIRQGKAPSGLVGPAVGPEEGDLECLVSLIIVTSEPMWLL